MFWLCSASLSLLDYRLIAVNALIYDLIATEIVSVNARIVVAASVMTEFDKSATRTITPTAIITSCETTKMKTTGMEITATTTTTISSNDTADVAFFEQKLSDDSDNDGISTNNNNNSNNKLTQTTNDTSNNTTQLAVLAASANGTFESITAARPLAVRAPNCWRYNNITTVMPTQTINEHVDNFRNDKKQTNERRKTTTAAVAAAKVDRNVAASKIVVLTPIRTTQATQTTTTATTTIAKRPAIKATITTAIKSTAMHLTTSALATATVMTATTTSAQVVASALNNTAIAEAFKANAQWATALTTTTTQPTTPTVAAAAVRHATPTWPTLRSHDLLSSTNGMPNCLNATSVCVIAEKSHAETNINTAATAATATTTPTTAIKHATAKAMESLLSTSSAVTSTALQTTKVAAAASRATTIAYANATYVAYVTNPVDTTTSGAAPMPMRSPTPCSTYSSLATRAAPANTGTTKTAHITDNAATKLTTNALQMQWQRILSRRKRYLAFSEGTSFTTSACITMGLIGNPNAGYMSFGINWGVAYDMPNATWILNQLHGLSRRPRPLVVHHRRSKRAIYELIAEAVDNMGYSGRDCVLRALCESRQYFARTKMGMIGEILRAIFSLPKQRIFSRELREYADIAAYDHAYRKARSLDCVTQYNCPFSLLELAFGKYSKPYSDYDDNTGM